MKRFAAVLSSSLLTFTAFAAGKAAHSTREIEGWTERDNDLSLNGSAEGMAEL